MSIYIDRDKVEKMEKTIIDFATGMTEWDFFENQHCYDDIIIL